MTQLFVNITNNNAMTGLEKLTTCLNDVQAWTAVSKLKYESRQD